MQQRNLLNDYIEKFEVTTANSSTKEQNNEFSSKTLLHLKIRPFSGVFEESSLFRDTFLFIIRQFVDF